MKRFFTLIAFLAINLALFNQAPQRLTYQTVIRNSSGGLVVSHAVGMKISILQGTSTGTPVYVETHTATTNANSLATNSITTEKINAGAVTGSKIAQAGATSGQALKWNGTTWAPAADATEGGEITLPWSGNTTTGIGGYAFTVISEGSDIGAISGMQTSTAAFTGGYGVYGESSSRYGTGVYALST